LFLSTNFLFHSSLLLGREGREEGEGGGEGGEGEERDTIGVL
jgi:hypothetical protein